MAPKQTEGSSKKNDENVPPAAANKLGSKSEKSAVAGKAPGKSMKADVSEEKGKSTERGRRLKKRNENYKSYIYKVHKDLGAAAEDVGISKKAMNVLNSFVEDIFAQLLNDASYLASISKRSTIGYKEVDSATKLLLTGEILTHARGEGKKAVTKFTNATS